ncbi:hypothetical protein RRG08_027125 [Elysia crispata]|uniref:Fibronectin type-III domain-containing protein n=1 Tax=Elysia crispata TaxID=231223 RepID=A0AAE0YV17_9GAST|nr:hypothetical protein RRG08_027125 [Elysia crispata]
MVPGTSSLVIDEFILTNNSITRLEDTSFQGLRVRALGLSGNAIASVSDHAFDPLARDLRELQMDGNLDGPPPESALNILTELEVLNLGNFMVQSIGDKHLYFLPFTHLKYLTLRRWNIRVIDVDAFKGPDSLQSLTLLQEENMFGLPLHTFREENLKTLKRLKISKTSLNEVSENSFSNSILTNLEELDLSDNSITHIRRNSLEGLGPALRKLSFASNFLRSDTSDLAGLRNLPLLEELDLSGNENINSIPDFSQLNSAVDVKIFLGNNKISALPPNPFSGITQRLHTLDLSQNSISRMDQDSFNGVTNLRMLRLSTQKGLASGELTLPGSLSQSANSLTHLFLDGQRLDVSALWDIVTHMAKLKVLDLSQTGLSNIPNLAFQKIIGLEELYLSGNSLTSLGQRNFVGPRFALKKLYLNQNPLAHISSCIFEQYHSFPIHLALQSVSLVCDCRLAWLLKAANIGKIIFLHGHAPLCTNHNNEPLVTKNVDEVCSNSSYIDAPCENLYRAPSLNLKIVKTTSNSITLSWSLSHTTDIVNDFDVKISDNYGDSGYTANHLEPRSFQVEAKPLHPNTQHEVCVTANFRLINSVTACTFARTELLNSSGPADPADSDDSHVQYAGIIIGAAAAGVLLLAVVSIIVYLLVFRRKPRRNYRPASAETQPRKFSKSELPSMTEDSHTFATQPKWQLDHRNGLNSMQVVAISDGQVNERPAINRGARVGRAAIFYPEGSYMRTHTGASSTQGTFGKGNVRADQRDQHVYENENDFMPKRSSYHNETIV